MTMWMIRGDAGALYDAFRDEAVAAIGWSQLAADARVGMTKKQLTELHMVKFPRAKKGTAISGAAQVWRFLNEINQGDLVTTYSPSNRTYLVGQITSAPRIQPGDEEMAFVRSVQWRPQEVDRDQLSTRAKNSLGATLTVFVVPELAASELTRLSDPAQQVQVPVPQTGEEEIEEEEDYEGVEGGLNTPTDLLSGVESLAIERIKDMVIGLDWNEMQLLVAGLLRAMGYKTQVSPAGPDRGKDIIASPDGFGFENPRIVVEVKHRSGQMGAGAIRSFIGGRQQHDRGLYVSTGGFSKDAYYEADRAPFPLMLWTMDNLVRALIEHYETTDSETKRLVPLKKTYLPA